MKPIVVLYVSRQLYQLGNDTIDDITKQFSSPDGEYHLFVLPSTSDATSIDIFPKFILVDDVKVFDAMVHMQTQINESVERFNSMFKNVSFLFGEQS